MGDFMRGGKRNGAGLKPKWYGQTVAMRVPSAWAAGITTCMDSGRIPVFDAVQIQSAIVHNQNRQAQQNPQKPATALNSDSVQIQSEIVQNQSRIQKPGSKRAWLAEVVNTARELREQGHNGAEIHTMLTGMFPAEELPTRSNMARWLSGI
jgi:hypothetical protein